MSCRCGGSFCYNCGREYNNCQCNVEQRRINEELRQQRQRIVEEKRIRRKVMDRKRKEEQQQRLALIMAERSKDVKGNSQLIGGYSLRKRK